MCAYKKINDIDYVIELQWRYVFDDIVDLVNVLNILKPKQSFLLRTKNALRMLVLTISLYYNIHLRLVCVYSQKNE